MFELKDKSALVTGASGGIGGAIARALHAQGAVVGLSGFSCCQNYHKFRIFLPIPVLSFVQRRRRKNQLPPQ